MPDTYMGTVSITPNGCMMQREAVVSYLKSISEHILMRQQLEGEVQRLRNELADVTRGGPDTSLPPEPQPPIQDRYPIFTLIIVPVFLVIFLFLDYSFRDKLLVVGVPLLCLILSVFHHHRGNKKAMEDWQSRKQAYEQEKARILALNSSVSSEDSSEVIAIKRDLSNVEGALDRLDRSRQELDNQNVLAVDYRQGMIPCVLYSYFLKGRANTLTEAINLFHTELHQEHQRQDMLKMEQEMNMHQEALMRQQNLNTARLSAQIENAKNEIELQSTLDTLYTVETMERLIRALS